MGGLNRRIPMTISPLIPGEIPVALSPTLAKLVGTDEAIFLARVHEDGGGDWLTRSLDEWAGLLSVSYCTVRRIVETLQRKRLITTKRSRRKSYRVDYARLEKFLAKATAP